MWPTHRFTQSDSAVLIIIYGEKGLSLPDPHAPIIWSSYISIFWALPSCWFLLSLSWWECPLQVGWRQRWLTGGSLRAGNTGPDIYCSSCLWYIYCLCCRYILVQLLALRYIYCLSRTNCLCCRYILLHLLLCCCMSHTAQCTVLLQYKLHTAPIAYIRSPPIACAAACC